MEFVVPFLRVIHILSGILWVGGTAVSAMFLIPTARRLGPAAGPFMREFAASSGFPTAVMLAGFFTVGAGAVLFPFSSGQFAPSWMGSSTGIAYSTGAAFGIVGLIFGLVWQTPAAAKLGALGRTIAAQNAPPTVEQLAAMQALQAKLATGGMIGTILLGLAAAIMAVARYV
jgi:uncharacterized membrane protein